VSLPVRVKWEKYGVWHTGWITGTRSIPRIIGEIEMTCVVEDRKSPANENSYSEAGTEWMLYPDSFTVVDDSGRVTRMGDTIS
jgi:hypothetical protein